MLSFHVHSELGVVEKLFGALFAVILFQLFVHHIDVLLNAMREKGSIITFRALEGANFCVHMFDVFLAAQR